MRLFFITAVLFFGCGQLPEQAGTTQKIKLPKNIFRHPDDALAFLRTHPAIKTQGLLSNLFAAELRLHPAVWGRYVNSDSALVTRRIEVDGMGEKYIFAKGFTPPEQIAAYLDTLDLETLKEGVPIAQLADNVFFQQEGWTTEVFHTSIGGYRDKKKYVTQLINVDGKVETYIYAKGFTPAEQIAAYLDSIDTEALQRGMPIAQVADNVSFKQENWTTHGFHVSIGGYLDKNTYVTQQINVDGKIEIYIFAKGFTPPEQIAAYLDTLDLETLKEGVPIAQVADNVSFKQENWTTHGFHTSIGGYRDKKKYVTQQISVDGMGEKYIFAKGFTPAEQIAAHLATLNLETLKEGVPIAQLADNVSFKQEGWTTEGFHHSIGGYRDKKKYVTQKIIVDGKLETYIFAKGFTPAEQIAAYLATLDLETLKEGVSIAQLADNVFFQQEGWTTEAFHNSIGSYLDKKKYVTQPITVDGMSEKYIFAKSFTPPEQIERFLATLDLETLKEGVPIAQVADNVSFKQESWTTEGFHKSIGAYLDKKKYVTQQIVVDGKMETYIFAKGFTPAEQIAAYLATLDLETLKEGVSIAQLADNVFFQQEGWTTEAFHNSIGSYLDKNKYVTQQIKVDRKRETYIYAK